uniref:Uncharacterized protein n=1 Tax=viral metagenome TaxID=1070528 RepID=A0A6M3K6A6_9ZZZZ
MPNTTWAAARTGIRMPLGYVIGVDPALNNRVNLESDWGEVQKERSDKQVHINFKTISCTNCTIRIFIKLEYSPLAAEKEEVKLNCPGCNQDLHFPIMSGPDGCSVRIIESWNQEHDKFIKGATKQTLQYYKEYIAKLEQSLKMLQAKQAMEVVVRTEFRPDQRFQGQSLHVALAITDDDLKRLTTESIITRYVSSITDKIADQIIRLLMKGPPNAKTHPPNIT